METDFVLPKPKLIKFGYSISIPISNGDEKYNPKPIVDGVRVSPFHPNPT
jgi:hypothetical protein